MSVRIASLRQASKKLAAKLRPAQLSRGMRAMGRGISRVPLSPVIMTVKAVGNVASSVPFVQGISEVTVSALERVEDCKQNLEDCKDLARLAEGVISAAVETTSDVPEEELDVKMLWNLAVLEQCMADIITTMKHLEGKAVWRRYYRKGKHDEALVRHKKSLENALQIFQMRELVAGRCAQRKDHTQTAPVFHDLQFGIASRARMGAGGRVASFFFLTPYLSLYK